MQPISNLISTFLSSTYVCRCCHSIGFFKDLSTECNLEGKELYEDLLRITFDIEISSYNNGKTQSSKQICDNCISKLIQAFTFRNMVISSENRMAEYFKELQKNENNVSNVTDEVAIIKTESLQKEEIDVPVCSETANNDDVCNNEYVNTTELNEPEPNVVVIEKTLKNNEKEMESRRSKRLKTTKDIINNLSEPELDVVDKPRKLIKDATRMKKRKSTKLRTTNGIMTHDINRPSQSLQTSAIETIYSKLPTKVQKALSNERILEYDEKKSLVHVAAEFMANDLYDFSLRSAKTIAKDIVDLYINSFKLKIGHLESQDVAEALGQKIYYRLHYLKKDQDDSCSSRYCSSDLDESFGKMKRDMNGCASFVPSLPSWETWQSLENKRLNLINSFKSSRPVNNDIIKQMSETYCLQRKHIQNGKNVATFFTDWPYFVHHQIIIAHANQLLGIDSCGVWNKSCDELSVPINCFFKNKEIVAEDKHKKKTRDDIVPDNLKYVRSELKKAKKYCSVLNNNVPCKIIMFDLIAKYMGPNEKVESLYVLVDEDVEDDRLFEFAEGFYPVLIIRGKDIHSIANVYDVVIEKKVRIRINSFLNGLLVTFLLYNIFGFVYPPEIEGTLETIQRLFLKIDPPKGTKRSGKRKSLVKFTKFIEDINSFKSSDVNDL